VKFEKIMMFNTTRRELVHDMGVTG